MVAVLLSLLAGLLPRPGPVGAAPLTNGGFTTSATVPSANVNPGDAITFTVRVTSSTDRTVLVYAEVNDPTAVRLVQFNLDNEVMVAGVERSFQIPWTVPAGAAAGGYTLAVRIYIPQQSQPVHLNDSAVFFTVGMASPPSGGPVRIMPLGDEFTDGVPINGGYRTELWTLLANAGHSVDFVGSRHNGLPALPDKQHEGHAGWTIADLAGGVTPWVRAYRPQVVMLLVGTNDLIQNTNSAGAPARLGLLIDQIRSELPDAAIVVSSLPRATDSDLHARIQTFNAALPGLVAAKGSKVSFTDAYAVIDANHLHTDGVHLTTNGYGRLAQAFNTAVHAVLNAQFPPTATPTPTATLTPTATITLTPTMTPGPCSPRPPVLLTTTRGAPGQLTAKLTVTGQGNGIREIRVGDALNATVQGLGTSGTALFSILVSGSPSSVTLTVTRRASNQSTHVPLVVVDQCGDWNTFVGGGPTAF